MGIKSNFAISGIAFAFVCAVISFAMLLFYKMYQMPSKPIVITQPHDKLVCPTPIIKVYNKNNCPLTTAREVSEPMRPAQPSSPGEVVSTDEFPRVLGRVMR